MIYKKFCQAEIFQDTKIWKFEIIFFAMIEFFLNHKINSKYQ
jgi:hypothetical protein